MKKELILNHLINLYLKENLPISSGELKKKCELPFSPSTIRNYFQKLDGEGLILKVHISSGSIPSKEAIQRYWYENLNFNNISLNRDSFFETSKKYDVFISFREKKNLLLRDVINVGNRFIIIDFQEDEIILRYETEIFHLFKEFIGYSLNDIKKMLKMLKLDYILKKIVIINYQNFNKEFLYKNYKEFSIDKLITDEIFQQFEKGLSFNNNFLAYNIDAKIDKKEGEFIMIGSLYNDYLSLFEEISA